MRATYIADLSSGHIFKRIKETCEMLNIFFNSIYLKHYHLNNIKINRLFYVFSLYRGFRLKSCVLHLEHLGLD